MDNRSQTFEETLEKLEWDFVYHSRLVHTEKWQGYDIKDKPEAAMHELTNVFFCCSMAGESLNAYREQLGPNLPWADDHFDERVCGQPLNPGQTWKDWPWALKADQARRFPAGPLLAPQDWAYLAGLIDGEGTIHFHTQAGRDHPHIRVIIAQKDHGFLQQVYDRYKVGTLNKWTRQTQVLNGREYEQNQLRWAICSHEEVTWVLRGVLPYLGVKRVKAEEALKILDDNPPSSKGRPRNRSIWNQQWELRFSHSYMQRYWPKYADNGSVYHGHMFRYGDLADVVNLLNQQPLTRQAYLPIFFPEDTGAVHGDRVPCTLGYHWLVRDKKIHTFYPIRSCDYYRHFRDDVYLTCRLTLWLLNQLRDIDRGGFWELVEPGNFSMWTGSLHMFRNDYIKLSSLHGITGSQ